MKTIKFLLVALMSIMLVGIVGVVFGSLTAATGAVLLAAGAAEVVAGESVTTENVPANLLRPEISKVITRFQPDRYPLDTILREVGNLGKSNAWEYQFWSSDVRGVTDVTTDDYTLAATTTAKIPVQNIHIWTKEDNIYFPTITGGDGLKLRAHVVGIDGSLNKLEVIPFNGLNQAGNAPGPYLPTIPDETPITRIGNAKGETDAQTEPYATMPTPESNYCQIIMTQVEESFIEKLHNKEVDWNILDFKKDALYDLRRQSEMAMLFGYKKMIYDPIARKYKYNMGGADYFLADDMTYTLDDMQATDFDKWGEQIFTGTASSDSRIVVAGNGFIRQLMGVPTIYKQLEANKTEIIAGIKFKKIETFFGDFLLKRHQGFNDVEGFTNHALVLDMENIERRIMEPMQYKNLKLDDTGQKRVDAVRIHETWTMAFRYPDTHRWIKATQGGG